QYGASDDETRAVRAPLPFEDDGVFAGQADGGAEPWNDTQAAPAGNGFDLAVAVFERGDIAPELVDQEAVDHGGVFGVDHRFGADDGGDDAAPVDVAHQYDRHVGGAGKAHVCYVARAQVDFGGRSRAFHDDDVALRAEPVEAVHHFGKKLSA